MAGRLRGTVADIVQERLDPLRPPGYRRVAAAMLVTNLGNGMQFIVNVWLVFTMTRSPAAVPLVLLAAALPGVVFGPFIGVAIDKFRRPRVFALAETVSAVVLAVAAVLSFTGALEVWHVFVAVFLLGLTESTAVPSGTSLVREIVPVDRLLAANATTGVAVQIGNVAGAAIGGILVAVAPIGVALVVNLVTFLLSAGFVLGVRVQRRISETGGGWRASVRRASLGLAYLRAHPQMLPSYLMLLVLFATLYLLNTLLAPFASEVLRVGPSGFGFIDAMFAFGAIAGGTALPLLTARLNRDRLAGLGVIGLGAALLLFAVSNGLVVPMLCYALAGISFQSFYVFRTRVQEQVPVDLQGRVMALLITSVGVCRLVVYGVLAVVASTVTLRVIYAVGGAALVVLGGLVTVRAFQRQFAVLIPQVEGN